ncbi:hypothetical protein C0J45_5633 [Silurus meridionalis]|nr:hypothetical protein C0J45_5633 [Silurus meridionalis]
MASLRHHHKNEIRMLRHSWKKFGLQDPVSSMRNDHTPAHSQKKSKIVKKKADERENEETKGSHCSKGGLSEAKERDGHSSSNTSGSSECHTDSDFSDQGQEMPRWAAGLELDLKSEPLDDETDHHFTETAFYPDVLPASLKVLDCTQGQSSETEQSAFLTDPCLAPVMARLMELERLQVATVQKERAKRARSRLATANTRNGNRFKKSEVPVNSQEAECNSVMCSFTKLVVCPNTSCRYYTCTSTKSGPGSKSKLAHPTPSKRPDSMSGKCKKADTMCVKPPQKPTVPNRTMSPKTLTRSISATKATVPNRKT